MGAPTNPYQHEAIVLPDCNIIDISSSVDFDAVPVLSDGSGLTRLGKRAAGTDSQHSASRGSNTDRLRRGREVSGSIVGLHGVGILGSSKQTSVLEGRLPLCGDGSNRRPIPPNLVACHTKIIGRGAP